MRLARSAYLLGAMAVGAARVLAAAAGFVSFWLLTQVLTKEELGGYAAAMGLVALAGLVATLGLDRALLLRVAARAPRARMRGRALAIRVAAAAAAAGCATAAVLAAFAEDIERMGLPGAGMWLPVIGLSAPALAVGATLEIWFRANQRVAEAALAPAAADIGRVALFLAVYLAGIGAAGVAWSAAAAAAAPAATLAWLATRGPAATAAPGRLSWRDAAAGGQFLTIRLASEGARQIDLLLVALLAGGVAAAEYAVAVRIAGLADAGRGALKATFLPRVRRHIASGSRAAALVEYDGARLGGLAVALSAAIALTAFGRPALGLFGDYKTAWPALLALTAAHLVNIGFGMHQSWVAMTGELRWSTALRVASLVLLAALTALMAPAYGAAGAAAAVLLSKTAANAAGAWIAWRRAGLRAVDLGTLAILAVSCAGLLGAAVGWLQPGAAAAVLGASLAAVLLRGRTLIAGALAAAAEWARSRLAA